MTRAEVHWHRREVECHSPPAGEPPTGASIRPALAVQKCGARAGFQREEDTAGNPHEWPDPAVARDQIQEGAFAAREPIRKGKPVVGKSSGGTARPGSISWPTASLETSIELFLDKLLINCF